MPADDDQNLKVPDKSAEPEHESAKRSENIHDPASEKQSQKDKLFSFACDACGTSFNNEIALKMHVKYCVKNKQGINTTKSSVSKSENTSEVSASKNERFTEKLNSPNQDPVSAELAQKVRTILKSASNSYFFAGLVCFMSFIFIAIISIFVIYHYFNPDPKIPNILLIVGSISVFALSFLLYSSTEKMNSIGPKVCDEINDLCKILYTDLSLIFPIALDEFCKSSGSLESCLKADFNKNILIYLDNSRFQKIKSDVNTASAKEKLAYLGEWKIQHDCGENILMSLSVPKNFQNEIECNKCHKKIKFQVLSLPNNMSEKIDAIGKSHLNFLKFFIYMNSQDTANLYGLLNPASKHKLKAVSSSEISSTAQENKIKDYDFSTLQGFTEYWQEIVKYGKKLYSPALYLGSAEILRIYEISFENNKFALVVYSLHYLNDNPPPLPKVSEKFCVLLRYVLINGDWLMDDGIAYKKFPKSSYLWTDDFIDLIE